MTSVNRDLQIVHLVSRFQQMTAKQIRGVVFASNLSDTPCDRALDRLVLQKMLARFQNGYSRNRRGNPATVYQLGSAGWKTCGYEGGYKPLTAIEPHKLAIADLYAHLKGLERAAILTLDDVETEPNNWVRIGHAELKPDLFARIIDPADGKGARFWFEVDLGTEHKKQIQLKARRYVQAYEAAAHSENDEWRYFPSIPWVVRDEVNGDDQKRIADLKKWTSNVMHPAGMFKFHTFADVHRGLVTL